MSAPAEAKAAGPKLYYFPVNARGDYVKILFEDQGAPYQFVPVAMGAHKTMTNLPFGQLPVLEDASGQVIGQTGAIVRLVAKRLNIYPTCLTDAALAESVSDQVHDIVNQLGSHVFTGKPTLEELKEYLNKQYAQFEAILAKSESKGEWFTKKFTFADLQVFQLSINAGGIQPISATTTPLLHAHNERVKARPGVAAFLASDRWIKPGRPPAKGEAPKH